MARWQSLTVGGIGYNGTEPVKALPSPASLPEQENGWTEWEAGNGMGRPQGADEL